MIFSIDEKKTNICVPQNLSIKKIRLSVLSFIIDNAELMSVEANKVVGKFFVNNFGILIFDGLFWIINLLFINLILI